MWPFHVHNADTPTGFKAKWDANLAKRDLARAGIDKRMEQRGRSFNATLVFLGFLTAAEIALIVAGIDYQVLELRWQFWPAAIGLILFCLGIMPTRGNLFPRHRSPEGEEAQQRDEWEWDYENVKRCSTQRSQLWRLRMAMTPSLLGLIVTLIFIMV